jgi:glucuronokinase
MPDARVAEVPARAALAGNPSDLYGGAVLAVPVPSLSTRVEFSDGPDVAIDGAEGARHFVAAALARIATTGSVRWSTTIPVGVGLAGSSALIVAVLRAARPGVTDNLELALLAQSIEADDLGIVAGLQDRAVQAFGRPVLVDVSGAAPRVEPITPAQPLDVFVAWLPAATADSGTYHAALRDGEPAAGPMAELADAARRAADAFAAGDAVSLAHAVAASAALRSTIAPLSAAHDHLAAAVAATGLSPNSTGSGGAVAAVVTGLSALEQARAAVAALGGTSVVETYG